MPVAFVLDEHLRGNLWRAVLSHNTRSTFRIDVVRVGDPADLPLGTKDPDLLLWAATAGRIVVSRDEKTMKSHFATHVQVAGTSPGLLLIRNRATLRQVVDFLVVAACA